MIIGIDYRLANRSHRGMARYCREIVKELFLMDSENEYILYIDCDPTHFFESKKYKYTKIGTTNFILGEQIYLPKQIKEDKCNIFWSPYNSFPIRIPKETKLIVTIHDVIFLYKLPKDQPFHQKVGALYRRFILKNYYKTIDACFTVSNYSKKELLKYIPLSIPIEITYNCISGFREKVRDFISLYGPIEVEDYFFTVSGDAPSKNLATLISVFEKEYHNQKLIIAGVGNKSDIRQGRKDNIIFLNEGISDNELISNYLRCKCFLFCSKYEGFGIPIIEAAICNKPIIASNTSSLPEIIGDKGILVSSSYNGIKEGVYKFLNDANIFDFNYEGILIRFENWLEPAKKIYNICSNLYPA